MRRTLVLFVIILLVCCCLPVYASTANQVLGLDTYDMPDTEIDNFLKHIKMKSTTEAVQNKSIACFDVSDDGLIAIGFGNGGQNTIDIYDENGVFLYGYQFYTQGEYTVSFQDENIAIYIVRGDGIAIFDANANLLNLQRVAFPHADHDKIKAIYNRTEKVVSGKTYYLDRDIGSGTRSYARLMVKNNNGIETAIYDETFEHTFRLIAMWIAIIGFCGFCILGLIRQLKNREEEQR